MKRIQLSDGMPTSVRRVELNPKTLNLLEKIKEECSKSGLSYVKVNKALHLADEELYKEAINKNL
ncbi:MULTISPECIES: hypothetical protein [unclassified Virgibacillus]|uniref:hypothetical protein n=1 Tax=unclassified Virgibacillus TaxID=2620237 RepID=UPI00090BCC7E|nr:MULTISPECIES: hypothetical protein [unclassified Virgibacillus]API92670.1 hypothetical protein BKP57_13170 [Virgibacillus sp. 6R]MBS7428163.1 hypothetical protein [Virgibacillus sp. 19R1-5]